MSCCALCVRVGWEGVLHFTHLTRPGLKANWPKPVNPTNPWPPGGRQPSALLWHAQHGQRQREVSSAPGSYLPKDRPQAPCLQPGQEVSIVSSSRRPNNAIGRGGPTLLPCARPHCTSGRLLPANSCRAATKRVYTHTPIYTHTCTGSNTAAGAVSSLLVEPPCIFGAKSRYPYSRSSPRVGVPPPAQEHTPPSPAPPWLGKPRPPQGGRGGAASGAARGSSSAVAPVSHSARPPPLTCVPGTHRPSRRLGVERRQPGPPPLPPPTAQRQRPGQHRAALLQQLVPPRRRRRQQLRRRRPAAPQGQQRVLHQVDGQSGQRRHEEGDQRAPAQLGQPARQPRHGWP